MAEFFRKWLNVYESELGLFLWSSLLLFFIRTSNIIFNNFAETAFLKRFGVEYLPTITAVNSVVTFVLMGLLTGYLARFPGDRILKQTLTWSALVVAGLRLVVPFDALLLYPVLYVMKTQLEVLMAFLFWNIANDLFSTRQSKRIFPLITSGGIVGGIAGSFATPLLARALAPDNLMLAFAAASLAGAWTVGRIGNLYPSEMQAGAAAPAGGSNRSLVEELREVVPLLRASTLAKILICLTLFPNIINPILNYQFSFAVDQTFATEGGMLGFYSYFRGAQNVISLVISLFVGRLYSRFGLPVALLFHPVNYILVFASFLVKFNVFSAVYSGVSVGVLRTTVNTPASNALYGLFSPRERGVMRPFLRGTVVRVGILFGSGAVLACQGLMHPRYLSLVALLFVGGWLAGVLVLRRRYAEILLGLVRSEVLDIHALEIAEAREVFRTVDVRNELLACLRAAHGADAVWYARVLRSMGVAGLDGLILEKLKEEPDPVRFELLPLLSTQTGERAIPVFRELLDRAKPGLMVALAHTATRVYQDMPYALREEIFAQSVNPEVKACVLPSLIDHDAPRYAPVLDGWLASGNVAEQRAGVLAAGDLGQRKYLEILRRMLRSDPDDSLLPLLLRALKSLGALDLSGTARPYLAHRDPTVRLAALEVLTIDDDDTARRVIRCMGDPSGGVRDAAIHKLETTLHPVRALLVEALGLHSRRIRAGIFHLVESMDVKDVEVFRFCRTQLERAYRNLAEAAAVRGLPANPYRDLLAQHLEQHQQLRIGYVLATLAARDHSGRMRVIQMGLESGDARRRSNALEALENALERNLARALLPLLESGGERRAAGMRHLGVDPLDPAPSSVLRHLLAKRDQVTSLLTLRLAADLPPGTVDPSVVRFLTEAENTQLRRLARRVARRHGEDAEGREVAVSEDLTTPDKVLHLRGVPMFESLSVSELAAVAQVTEEVSYPTGATIFAEGDSDDRLFLVLSGEVALDQESGDGRTRELTTFGPGESFNELSLFYDDPGPRPVSARIKATAELLVIAKRDFQEILKEYPEIAISICRELGKRVMMLLERVKRAEQ